MIFETDAVHASLRCKEIVVRFGGIVALDSVSLSFEQGMVVSLIGPNGAGKTTLINALTGFVGLRSGDVALGEQRLTHLQPHVIARAGVLRSFQSTRIIKRLPVADFVSLAAQELMGERVSGKLFATRVRREEQELRTRVHEVLYQTGLWEQRRELTGALSYGQQKLLWVACCLLSPCRFFLMDEPTSGVSSEHFEKLAAAFTELKSQGRGLVIVEHNMQVVRAMSDRVVALDNGRVIATGSADAVLSHAAVMEAFLS